MLSINIRPKAKEDIKKIWHYTFENWGEQQADSYTTELGQSIEDIISNPEIGIPIDYIRESYRQLHVKHHLVIYRLTDSTIEVTRVLGDSMDAKQHL